MTIEEAKKSLELYIGDGSMEWANLVRTDVLKIAYDALEKEHKYIWHDLKKNPDDLPSDDSIEYIVCVEYRNGKRECTVGCLDMGGEMMLLPALGNWIGHGYRIIAWRYIEPFEATE